MSNRAMSCAPAPASRFRDWILSVGPFWAASIAGHLVLLIGLALAWGTVRVAHTILVPPDFTAASIPSRTDADIDLTRLQPDVEQPPGLEISNFTVEDPPAPDISADSLAAAPDAISSTMPMGLGPLALNSISKQRFGQSVTRGEASSIRGPSGEPSNSMSWRTDPAMIGTLNAEGGGTKLTDKAVHAALVWFARHQLADGSWSMDCTTRCADDSCTHAGSVRSTAAATSFALLPFLAAGMTPSSKSVVTVAGKRLDYSRAVAQGLAWLVDHQRGDGNLADGPHVMYTHGLATIALCEAYAMTHDRRIGDAAQAAVRFIELAQSQDDGGWRYTPRAVPGDTSVVGWQVMALKSAQLAGLSVSPETLRGVKRYLKRASVAGRYGGVFSYLPDDKVGKISMTAVGMLCNQYMGLERGDPALLESRTALLQNLPSARQPNLYYWYYATQAMHNMAGPEWDAWNRAMRRVLVETQTKEGCALGSWNPEVLSGQGHVADAGGRLMATSLAALSLEVYYRYLPLYQTDALETAAR